MASTKLNITELDFDDIKSNLKAFMKAQGEFTDYNFEGSALTVLMNLLAYNTHYNAYYTNMAINESFLDSAIKRSSVVSRAKTLGYTPRSARSATALVDVIITTTDEPESIVLPKGTVFITSSQGDQFTFVATTTMQTSKSEGVYKFTDVVLNEGNRLSYTYEVNKTTNPGLVFEIPTDNVDTSLLTVRVQKSVSDSATKKYEFADGVGNISAVSDVYWIQENYKGRYEIYFGDGFLGSTLADGNIVYIEYVIPTGVAANGAKFFSTGSIAGYSGVSVVTKSPAAGGAAKEDSESIKFYAPKAYASQQRLVTADDYMVHIHKNFPQLSRVVVWGGEDNVPPVYGKVFICGTPTSDEVLSDSMKNIIRADLAKKRVMSITTEFVDPIYTYVGLDISVSLNRTELTKTVEQMKGIVVNGVTDYFDTIDNFGGSLIMSRLTRAIDNLDSAIVGSHVKLRLMKTHAPLLGVFNQVSTFLSNYVVAGSFYSTAFNVNIANKTVLGYFVDDAEGNVSFVDYQTKQTVVVNVGTINYDSGKLDIGAFLYESVPFNNNLVYFYYNQVPVDVRATRNQILLLDKNIAQYNINRKQGVSDVKIELSDD